MFGMFICHVYLLLVYRVYRLQVSSTKRFAPLLKCSVPVEGTRRAAIFVDLLNDLGQELKFAAETSVHQSIAPRAEESSKEVAARHSKASARHRKGHRKALQGLRTAGLPFLASKGVR